MHKYLSVSGQYAGVKMAVYQMDEYQSVVQGRLSVTTIASGDFNLGPSEVRPWWFSALKNGDLQCTSPSSTMCDKTLINNSNTIDYTFRAIPRSWTYDAYLESTVWSGQTASDHKLLVGYP